MNHNIDTKTICFIGYGNFYYVAEKLSKTYGRALYYLPYETAFPKYNQYIVGMGIEGVERIYNIWDYYDSIDIFYFEDLFQGAFQQWLRGQNKIVFGAGKGEDMEIYRDRFKDLQKELGMPLNNHVVIKGIDALTEHLKYKQDVFVKTNIMRGNMETFHWDNYDLSKPILDELQHSLGAYKNEITFIVEDPIKDALEYGFDGFTVDGKYPDKTFFGCEIKDAAYACQFTDYENLPTPVKEANEKLAPIFASYNYRGSYSNEMRATDKKTAVLTDMTCRNPEPPTSLMIEMMEDYGLYVWQVANGIVPKIKSRGKFGVMIVIKSDWARTEPQAIYFPEHVKEFVKIKSPAIIDGVLYSIPQTCEMQELGSVIAYADTLGLAIEKAKAISEEIKGYCVKCNANYLDAAQDSLNQLPKYGFKG